MQVIMLEKVENLGNLGDLVDVKAGYARNFLIPSGKAQFATPANIEAFAARRAELEKELQARIAQAEQRKSSLDGIQITITAKAGTEGKLFGSVGANEIGAALEAAGHKVERREIRLPDGPLRSTGEFVVDLHLHSGIDAAVQVVIEADNA